MSGGSSTLVASQSQLSPTINYQPWLAPWHRLHGVASGHPTDTTGYNQVVFFMVYLSFGIIRVIYVDSRNGLYIWVHLRRFILWLFDFQGCFGTYKAPDMVMRATLGFSILWGYAGPWSFWLMQELGYRSPSITKHIWGCSIGRSPDPSNACWGAKNWFV